MNFPEDAAMLPIAGCAPKPTEGMRGQPSMDAGHDPVEEQAWFWNYEPRRNVTADSPTLSLHGEKDTDVRFEQSVLIGADTCRSPCGPRAGIEPELGKRFRLRERRSGDPAGFRPCAGISGNAPQAIVAISWFS